LEIMEKQENNMEKNNLNISKCYNMVKIIKITLQTKIMNCKTNEELDMLYVKLNHLLDTLNKKEELK